VADLRVALTFDAEHPSRPHSPPGVTEGILRRLDDAGIRATFFLQGRWVTARPQVARSIAAAGHLIGNHSHYHARFTSLAPEGVREDLQRAEAAIVEATGVDPRPWFRFPFGDGQDEAAIGEIVRSLGYRQVGWHVDPNDWDDARSAEELEGFVVEQTAARGSDTVVLLHGWPSTTGEALPRMVSALRAEGAQFVGVDELASPPSGADVHS
jgi:peptidoglycan-N-acetylglucosamine deacetylase